MIGVTGSTGFLGRSLVAAFAREGPGVVAFRRATAPATTNRVERELDLNGPIDAELFKDVSCVFYAEWDLTETDPRVAWERNVEGSKRVLNAALAAGVQRFIFVSSMSAYFGTRQEYGLMKLAVERSVLEAGQVVVRPGLVYGPTPGGMVQTLTRLARLPVLPVFRGAYSFTLHVDDFVAAMVTLAHADVVPSSVFGLAHPSPVPFKDLMIALARDAGVSRKTVVVPWHPLLAALRMAERTGVPLPVRSDSLLGLVRPAPSVPGRDAAAALGLAFRSFNP